MISERDILLAANLLIERHGDDAINEAVRIGSLMQERGDREGVLHWYRIRRAIEWLQNPPSKARH